MLYTDIWDKSNRNIVSRMETPDSPIWVIQQFNARYLLPDGSETILDILDADKDKLYCLLEASVACNFMKIEKDANPVVMILQLKP